MSAPSRSARASPSRGSVAPSRPRASSGLPPSRLGELKVMPTPLDIITKPLQIGAQVAFGAIQEVQKRFGGAGEHDEAPQQPQPQPERERAERPAAQRR